MKKSNFIYLFVLLAGMVCLDGCKKKEDPAPVPRKELLAGTSSKKWKVTSATYGTIDVIAIAFPRECDRDNLFVFFKDNKLVLEEGAQPCNPTTTGQGTWSLSTDEKTLTINAGGGNVLNGDFTIVEISNTTVKGTFPYNLSGTPITVNVTLAAQ